MSRMHGSAPTAIHLGDPHVLTGAMHASGENRAFIAIDGARQHLPREACVLLASLHNRFGSRKPAGLESGVCFGYDVKSSLLRDALWMGRLSPADRLAYSNDQEAAPVKEASALDLGAMTNGPSFSFFTASHAEIRCRRAAA